MSDILIDIKQLTFSRGERVIYRDLNMQFARGKVTAIMGPSGIGKTTLLRLIGGQLKPDSGEILFDKRDLCSVDYNGRKEIRKEVGMLFQASALFDFRTVLGNVMFPLEMFSDMDKNEREERAIACLKRVNIKEEAFKLSPAEISGGMQKRVAIARAIVNNPKYLFCDEPNSGLDPNTAILIDNLIKEITEEYNITTVVNTHDMNSVMEIGDKILFLKNGVKAWEGTKEEIFRTDNEAVVDFVYSSELFKKVREAYLKE